MSESEKESVIESVSAQYKTATSESERDERDSSTNLMGCSLYTQQGECNYDELKVRTNVQAEPSSGQVG